MMLLIGIAAFVAIAAIQLPFSILREAERAARRRRRK